MLNRAIELVAETLAVVVKPKRLRHGRLNGGGRRIVLHIHARYRPRFQMTAGPVAHANALPVVIHHGRERVAVLFDEATLDVLEEVLHHFAVGAKAARSQNGRAAVDLDVAGIRLADNARHSPVLHDDIVSRGAKEDLRAVLLGYLAVVALNPCLAAGSIEGADGRPELQRTNLTKLAFRLREVCRRHGGKVLLRQLGEIPVRVLTRVLSELHDKLLIGVILRVEHEVLIELDRIDIRHATLFENRRVQ